MFRKELPRVYELRDKIKEPNSPKAYFQDFDNSLRNSPLKKKKFCEIEILLQGLDTDSWEFLKDETSEYLEKKIEGRGWEQLFNFINQAWGYNYLKSIDCTSIRFVPRSQKKGMKSPDLIGMLGSVKVKCEVKTINISKNEAQARCGIREVRHADIPRLEQGFFEKLMDDLIKAKKQLEFCEVDKEARLIVYIFLNFDDFWGEFKADYFQQIDQYLADNQIHGIEIVFHNSKTSFHEPITMKYAAVFNE